MNLKKIRIEIGKHEAARRANRDCLKHSLEIGKNLLMIKEELPHGIFKKWIKDNLSYRYRQCAKYMKLAKQSKSASYCTFDEDLALLQYFKGLNRGTRTAKPPLLTTNIPKGKYHTIVVDPPWSYGNNSGRQKQDYHQRTMNFDEIKKFDIQRWIPEDFCHLYLWVTDIYAGKVFEILESWGFVPKTWLIWIKDNIGMGNYFRHQHEFCVFAIKGKQRLKRMDVSTIFHAPMTKHSEKPDYFYSLIKTCSFEPFLDVFARKMRPGWDVFGDEVNEEFQMKSEGNNESSFVG